MPIIVCIVILGVIILALIIKGDGSNHLGSLLGMLVPLIGAVAAGGTVAGFASVPLSPFVGIPIGILAAIYVFKKIRR